MSARTAEQPHILSIDLGTGGPKVALVDAAGGIAAAAARPVTTHHLPPKGAEQDPEEIWDAIGAAIGQVMHTAGCAAETIAAVSVASQYFSIVPVDRDACPVGNLVLWMDGRGGPYARAIYERHPDALLAWVDLHGIPPLPSGNDSLSHILWIQHERPDVYARTHAFLEPMDFVTARLTGACLANPCSAFPLLLTDNRRPDAIAYADALIDRAGIDRAKLPELRPAASCLGTVAPEVARTLGLSPRTRVFAGINDSQAVAVGTATFRGGHAGVNMGTTSALVAHVPFKRSDPATGIVSMPSPIPHQYVVMGENGIGARALEYFLRSVVFTHDALGDHRADDVFAPVEAAVASVPPGAGGVLFLPWLIGSQSPVGSTKVRGGFLNLSLATSRAGLVRAVLEGVAYNLRWLLPHAEAFAERRFDHLRLSGGAARSDQWCQIVADVTDRPVVQLEEPRHVINRATAFLAGAQLGLAAPADVDRFCPARRSFEPRSETRTVYERLFAQFLNAFERNREIFEALNAAAGDAE
jgi:xylulokinase